VSFAGSVIVFATVVIVASLVPARRAASVNPVDALRAE
jgi:ABC-type lipoprotein release transport system permease subunit